eukprot:GAHX01000608.1.p1 GENE.GAHX01000608.1~~GAHX01000608.1.p1  ORF type:complete len:434 (+),score=90.18 GAHX01000608.1:41-1342(+)
MSFLSDKDLLKKYSVRSTIKKLQNCKGAGTSMISLVLKSGQQLTLTIKMLQEEYSTASNIKSRVNRQSVQTAITSTLERLKMYTKTPPNGLVVFCGLAKDDNNKEKKVTIDFEPFKPMLNQMYYCDSKFHTELLEDLLASGETYGFVIISGQDALIGQINGNHQEVLKIYTVELPKKHNKGGQSAMRYGRLRIEKRLAFVRKTAEAVNKLFIESDGSRVKIKGLIVGGPASLKNDFAEDIMLDGRLRRILLKVVDTAQGLKEGFRQAIELTQDALEGLKLGEENKVIMKLLEEYKRGSGKACIGASKVVQALEAGACEEIIVWEDLEVYRVTIAETEKDENDENKLIVKFKDETELHKRNINFSGEIVKKEKVVDVIVDGVKSFGSDLVFVTKNSSRGRQFVKTFGGVGAILKYKMTFSDSGSESEESESDDD